MIHIKVTIEPEEGEEIDVVGISFIRDPLMINAFDQHKFAYAGWVKDKKGEVKNFNSSIFSDRKENILKIVSKILIDALDRVNKM